MSRIGDRKLVIPAGVTVSVENNVVTVKGPKGELTTNVIKDLEVKVEGDTLEVLKGNDSSLTNMVQGTMNANLNNMLIGVTKGFKKELEIIGVGYRFAIKGNKLVINAGYSHPVELDVPEGIKVEVPSNTELTINGIDKILVGEFAAQVRKVRQPEPYKGKGIRYKDEHVRRKEGKKAA
jgi:large subunit ribosomal protein L6